MRLGLPGSDDLDELIEQLYDCSVEPDLWFKFLNDMAQRFGAGHANFYIANLPDFSMVLNVSNQSMKNELEDYSHKYAASDPRASVGIEHAGNTITCRQHIHEDELRSSDLYRHWMRPFDVEYSMWTPVNLTDNMITMMGVFRSRRGQAFDPEECRRFDILKPHMARTARLAGKLTALARERNGAFAAMAQMAFGVLLLDAKGKVVHQNPAAEIILRQKDGLSLANGRLLAARSNENTMLQGIIQAAVQRRKLASPADRGGALALPRPSGKQPLSVAVMPLSRMEGEVTGLSASAVLFVTDPEATPLPPENRLAALYGLSVAESSLVQSLMSGQSLEDHAQSRGIKLSTAKTQLLGIFRKTETAKQSDLVRKLSTSAVTLLRD
ncbi:MAG: hypothetical protein HQL44_16185 [Alphaproteobacteria bacterium]|nr:hypothetical protein [Alphaproteobacteria bacterium]